MLTQTRLKELLSYDPGTGEFVWRVFRGGSARAGSKAGVVNHYGYRVICVDGRQQQAGRLAYLYMTGDHPEDQVDHINGDAADDRWDNIRNATASENLAHRGVLSSNKRGLKGVWWCSQKRGWISTVTKNRKIKYLGLYDCPAAAHLAYVVAAARVHGEFARFS